jgi:hypothetical protein
MTTTISIFPDDMPTGHMFSGDLPVLNIEGKYGSATINLGNHPDPIGWLEALIFEAVELARAIEATQIEVAS